MPGEIFLAKSAAGCLKSIIAWCCCCCCVGAGVYKTRSWQRRRRQAKARRAQEKEGIRPATAGSGQPRAKWFEMASLPGQRLP
mmetsp:Transcript_15882/g.40513  ORF Transcript_15882/g.40513 Transcript_15882/m.40513 type:complete len:83 (+) Transcript_15882:134-382(+)